MCTNFYEIGGDANGDDTIDKQDVETLRDYILGSLSSSPVNADVDGNNKVDIVDLTKLIEYLTK